MRGLRSFLLLLVVCAGLAAYLYFVESKRDPSAADKKDKVFTVEADKIDEMTVKSESGEQTTLKKTGTDVADRRARGRRSPMAPRSRG